MLRAALGRKNWRRTHAECVTGELCDLLHRRVTPDDDLVLRLPGREPVRRDELV